MRSINQQLDHDKKVDFINEHRPYFSILTPRERDIVNMRCQGWTLEEIGTIYGVTRERIRCLEIKALEKLKKAPLNYPDLKDIKHANSTKDECTVSVGDIPEGEVVEIVTDIVLEGKRLRREIVNIPYQHIGFLIHALEHYQDYKKEIKK
jgi:transcriptional regulator